MASKLFGGVQLGDIAREVKERAEPSPLAKSLIQPKVPAAELALTGRSSPGFERENILSVDPKRCRPWKFHNRTEAWYTKERCQDLIDSFAKDGQQQPALARKLSGDSKYEYELIYGMRRRFAAEYTSNKLKLRLVEIDDAKAAILMHVENADRQDITPMERGLSFQVQLEGGVFETQDAMASAFNLSKGQVTKLLKAAQLLKHPAIAGLFVDKGAIPIEPAYGLSVLMDRSGGKEIILKAAANLTGRAEWRDKPPAQVLKHLAASLERSKQIAPVRREYSVSASTRMVMSRNAKGKVTLAFPQGAPGGRQGGTDNSDRETVPGPCDVGSSFVTKLG